MKNFNHLLLTAALCAVTSVHAEAVTLAEVIGDTPVYGYYVSYGDGTATWQKLSTGTEPVNIWSEPADNSSYVMIEGWMKDNQLCGISTIVNSQNVLTGYRYSQANPISGEIIEETIYTAFEYKLRFSSAVYSKTDDTIYGFGMNPDEGYYPVWKKTTGDGDMYKMEYITTLEDPYSWSPVLCITPETEEIYGITFNGYFVKIEKDGTQTEIFKPEINVSGKNSGLAYIPSTDKFLLSARLKDGSTALYAIDATAMTCELIEATSDNGYYSFFSVGDEAAADGVPQVPVIDNVSFLEGSASGTVDITLPTQTLTGDDLSGMIKWYSYVDGNSYGWGVSSAGKTISADFDELSDGIHTLSFSVEYKQKESARASIEVYIGNDTPLPTRNVNLTVAGNVLTAEWTAVTEGIHGGWIDLDNLTYEVYLNNNLIEETKDTQWSHVVNNDQPYTAYQVEIIVKCNGLKSTGRKSNSICYGNALSLPLIIAPTAEQGLLMTYIADENGMTWKYNASIEPAGFTSGYYSDYQLDDWMITPPFALLTTAGQYELTFETSAYRDYWGGDYYEVGDEEYYDVWLGNAPAVSGMTTQLVDKTKVEDETLLNKIVFSVEEPGTYYVGFHGLSERWMPGVVIRNIKIADITNVGVGHMTSENITIEGGEGKIHIKGLDGSTASVYTIGGRHLCSVSKDTTINVACGMYIVTVNGLTRKVMVK